MQIIINPNHLQEVARRLYAYRSELYKLSEKRFLDDNPEEQDGYDGKWDNTIYDEYINAMKLFKCFPKLHLKEGYTLFRVCINDMMEFFPSVGTIHAGKLKHDTDNSTLDTIEDAIIAEDSPEGRFDLALFMAIGVDESMLHGFFIFTYDTLKEVLTTKESKDYIQCHPLRYNDEELCKIPLAWFEPYFDTETSEICIFFGGNWGSFYKYHIKFDGMKVLEQEPDGTNETPHLEKILQTEENHIIY